MKSLKYSIILVIMISAVFTEEKVRAKTSK